MVHTKDPVYGIYRRNSSPLNTKYFNIVIFEFLIFSYCSLYIFNITHFTHLIYATLAFNSIITALCLLIFQLFRMHVIMHSVITEKAYFTKKRQNDNNQMAPISSIGWSAPISLLTAVTETRTVSGRMASRSVLR